MIVVLGFLAAYQPVQPPPPKPWDCDRGKRRIHAFAQKYARLLARDGSPEVVPTAGSIENLDLLVGVSLALRRQLTDADRDQLEFSGSVS